MMRIKPLTWWVVFAAMLVAGAGFAALLVLQGFVTAGQWVGFAANIAVDAWVVFGLIRFRENVWVRRIAAFLIATLVMWLLVQFALAVRAEGWARMIAGAWAMGVLFFGGLHLIRLALSPGYAVTGVARTLLDEAIRMKVPLIFIVLLLLIVPALPLVLDPEEQLRYRIQSFVFWSLTATSLLLSLMTLFLAVGTITQEIGQRQIFLTLTKPVGRGQYLLGKWLGIMALNLLLVSVAGGAIYLITMQLAAQPAQNRADALAVQEEVLVARNAVAPVPPEEGMLAQMLRERVERLRQNDPQVYGQPGEPIDALPDGLLREVQQQVLVSWYSLPPRGARVYRFTGLQRAKELGPTVQLRLKPRGTGRLVDGYLHLGMLFNGYRLTEGATLRFPEGIAQVVNVPTELIGDDGVLDVTLANIPVQGQEQPSISFTPNEDLQVLYRVGGFEANFARALLVLWVRLGFLAMLGLAAGTYLGFPVACLLALLVYFAAVGSGYLGESLSSYAAFPRDELPLWDKLVWVPANLIEKLAAGEVWAAVKVVVRLIGSGFMLLVPSFGDYNPTPMVAEGRSVSPRLVGGAFLWVGLVWTGTVALIAWLIFRQRELARVTV